MPGSRTPEERNEAVFAALEPIVRRVVAARMRRRDLVDDLVQETLARVLAAGPKLEDEALVAYAVVSARRVVSSHLRQQERGQRLEPRLAAPRQPESPETAALADEERRAVDSALARLSEDERAALIAHDVAGVDRASLARKAHSTPGAIGARLTRARAKLRVEYLLAFRGTHLPTPQCRSILLAISAGDRARQRSLGTAAHLLTCPTCPKMSSALLERRRPLAGLWPIPPLQKLTRDLRRHARQHPAQTGAIGASVATLAVATFLAWPRPGPTPTGPQPASPPPPAELPCGGTLNAGGKPVVLGDAGAMRQLSGQRVEGRHLLVQSVPTDEGFWAGCEQPKIWVQLIAEGESPFTVRAGQRVDLVGTVTPNPPGFLATIGLAESDGAQDLEAQGYHIEVSLTDLALK